MHDLGYHFETGECAVVRRLHDYTYVPSPQLRINYNSYTYYTLTGIIIIISLPVPCMASPVAAAVEMSVRISCYFRREDFNFPT